ncbi:MAG: hypothetical protein B7Z72_12270 [Gemmatimonadetes bacterium 21-71-4]|nr:MAG: hypothetical protein B7Z72_12270 [Gemmatimonadetes bacterium 21-71-4]
MELADAMERRARERRAGHDRRGGGFLQRPAATAGTSAAPGPVRRLTEPRQLSPLDTGDHARLLTAAEVTEAEVPSGHAVGLRHVTPQAGTPAPGDGVHVVPDARRQGLPVRGLATAAAIAAMALVGYMAGHVGGGGRSERGTETGGASVPPPPPPAAAAEPDSGLAAGGWLRVARADAISALGGTLGVIPGLSIESMAQSAAGDRPRVRVAQLTASGERIVLTETRAGADVRGGPGPAAVTSIGVMPASKAYPWSTGTVSFGNILVTAETHLAADALRSYLGRMTEASPER